LARPGAVPFWTEFCCGFGQIGEAAFMSVTLTFAGLYYNQALRLLVDLVGWALALAILFDAISDPAVGGLNVVVMSMLADIVDQHTLATAHVMSGMFYSARAFFAKASHSLATLLGGLLLMHVVRIPVGAVPGELEAGVVSRLGWVGVAHFVGALVSLVFYARYRLSRQEHDEIRRQLDTLGRST
jgi:Na+/melibiose symporter-like transporter